MGMCSCRKSCSSWSRDQKPLLSCAHWSIMMIGMRNSSDVQFLYKGESIILVNFCWLTRPFLKQQLLHVKHEGFCTKICLHMLISTAVQSLMSLRNLHLWLRSMLVGLSEQGLISASCCRLTSEVWIFSLLWERQRHKAASYFNLHRRHMKQLLVLLAVQTSTKQ